MLLREARSRRRACTGRRRPSWPSCPSEATLPRGRDTHRTVDMGRRFVVPNGGQWSQRFLWGRTVQVARRGSRYGRNIENAAPDGRRFGSSSLTPRRITKDSRDRSSEAVHDVSPRHGPRCLATSQWRPRQDSNLRHRLRRPVLYPLSYGGGALPTPLQRRCACRSKIVAV
jgi:hypothetical protein